MPEVIMQYDINEGKMIALKRKEPLIRCLDCTHYVGSGVEGIRMCDITLRVKGINGYCNESERKIK